jgi:hypothetical protein
MITLDDCSITSEQPRVKKLNAYMAFDVAARQFWMAFDTRSPDREMVLECLRSMYVT